MFSYSIADFLAYDKAIWLGMVSRYIADWWWVGGGAVVLLVLGVRHWLANPAVRPPKFMLLVLAICWGWIAWQFHWHEHRALNWAAGYWSAAFAVQAGLLAVTALRIDRLPQPPGQAPADAGRRTVRSLGWLAIAGTLVLPALTGWLVDSTPIWGFEWFGLTPDASALMTLMLLVLWRQARPWVRAGLAVLPALSLLVSVLLSYSLQVRATAVYVGIGTIVMAALLVLPAVRRSHDAMAS